MMLDLFEERLKLVEATLQDKGQDFCAYADALAFLDIIYLLSRMLLDSTAGVVRHFYKLGIRHELPASFNDMFKKSIAGKLPDSLNPVFTACGTWFPLMRDRRDAIVHHCETGLIGFDRDTEGRRRFVQFSTRNTPPSTPKEDVRVYLGSVLAGYQQFIDALLDHWDAVFNQWYGIGASIHSRHSTILEGRAGNILWWAYHYGGYRHDRLVVEL